MMSPQEEALTGRVTTTTKTTMTTEPENKENRGGASTEDDEPLLSQLQQYKNVRDEYFRRKLMRSVLQYGQSFDGRAFTEMPADSDDEDDDDDEELSLQQLHQQGTDVLGELHKVAQDYQRFCLEHQVKVASMQQRQEEVDLFAAEIKAKEKKEKKKKMNNNYVSDDDEEEEEDNVMDMEMDNNNNVSISELELAAEEERLVSLQKKKALLLQQLQATKEQHQQLVDSTKEHKKKMNTILKNQPQSVDFALDFVSEESLARLQLQTSQLESQAVRYEEMSTFFQGMASIVEQLRGVRVVSITSTTDTTSLDKEEDEKAHDGDTICLVVQLLEEYTLEIMLKTKKNTDHPRQRQRLGNYPHEEQESLRVVHAKLLGDTTIILRGGGGPKEAAVFLEIPSLDDLVQMVAAGDNKNKASTILGGGGETRSSLCFLVGETISRIETLQARINDLALLQHDVAEMVINNNVEDGFGDTGGHNVVCTVPLHNDNDDNEIKVVLRLTRDCPMVEGSVYIADIIPTKEDYNNNNDWETFKTEINDGLFASPVELMRAVQHKLSNYY